MLETTALLFMLDSMGFEGVTLASRTLSCALRQADTGKYAG